MHHICKCDVPSSLLCLLIPKIGKVSVEEDFLRKFLFLKEHKHIDWEVGYTTNLLHISSAEDESFVNAIIRIVQHVVHGIMAIIVLSRFDFQGDDFPIFFKQEIQFPEFLAVEIIERVSVGNQFFSGSILVY